MGTSEKQSNQNMLYVRFHKTMNMFEVGGTVTNRPPPPYTYNLTQHFLNTKSIPRRRKVSNRNFWINLINQLDNNNNIGCQVAELPLQIYLLWSITLVLFNKTDYSVLTETEAWRGQNIDGKDTD